MDIHKLLEIIQQGEGDRIEFKESKMQLTADAIDTVCSFSNHTGGHLLLGIKDDKTVVGIQSDKIDKVHKEFVTSIKNTNRINPPLVLHPEEFEIEGAKVLYIYVPERDEVTRTSKGIFDRNHDSDVNIMDSNELMFQLYSRKRKSYFVNTLYPGYWIQDLRHDLFERVRNMSNIRTQNHPWKKMTDEELLRSSGLILKERETRKDCLTLAAILLFGKDSTIMGVLPQHKTDALIRVENTDRYDDRDVIITNLLDTYDRLMEFGKKHLSNPFVLDGIQSVSPRDIILREIFSNILAHRDYSSGLTAKFVIEKDRMYTENANQLYLRGVLNPQSFQPFSKNPPISKVFREIGLADELGSGVRNTRKFSKLYSGEEPVFQEDSLFITEIPLTEVATLKVGPQKSGMNAGQDTGQDAGQDAGQDVALKKRMLLSFCKIPRTRSEMQLHIGISSRGTFRKTYLEPMIRDNYLVMTIPEKPNSKYQKYLTVVGN